MKINLQKTALEYHLFEIYRASMGLVDDPLSAINDHVVAISLLEFNKKERAILSTVVSKRLMYDYTFNVQSFIINVILELASQSYIAKGLVSESAVTSKKSYSGLGGTVIKEEFTFDYDKIKKFKQQRDLLLEYINGDIDIYVSEPQYLLRDFVLQLLVNLKKF
jgi:hypothetical protein